MGGKLTDLNRPLSELPEANVDQVFEDPRLPFLEGNDDLQPAVVGSFSFTPGSRASAQPILDGSAAEASESFDRLENQLTEMGLGPVTATRKVWRNHFHLFLGDTPPALKVQLRRGR